MIWAIAIPLAFLSGAIPFGLLIARSKGVDIRAHGSGNIGATNVGRVMGRRYGMICFILDVSKGLLPTLGAGAASGLLGDVPAPRDATLWLLVALSTILGHMFTPFAGFKGGKGVATGLGALLGTFPILTVPALGAFVVWVAMVRIWHYVGIASCAAAILMPLFLLLADLAWLEGDLTPYYVALTLLATLVTWKHRGNIKRTFNGTEAKVWMPKDKG